jgi:CHAT domain-containing protein/tetratricopeptide (TPR) repeat protein
MLKLINSKLIKTGFLLSLIMILWVQKQANGQSFVSLLISTKLDEYERCNKFDDAILLMTDYQDSVRQKNNSEAAFESAVIIADLYRMKGQCEKAKEVLDSLNRSGTTSRLKNNQLRGQYFTVQGTLLLTRGELKKGLTAILSAIDNFNHSVPNPDTLLGPCYNKLGNYYFFTKNYDSSLYWYSRAMATTVLEKNNLQHKASYLQNMGIIYLEQHEYGKAEEYFLESLKIKESIFSENSFTLGRLYLNIGKFYQNICAFDKAEKYLSKSETIYSREKTAPSLEQGSILWNRGLIYHLSGESELALTYLFNARQIIDSAFAENQNLIGALNADIGNVYKNLFQYKKAEEYYNKSLKCSNTTVRIKSLRNLAIIYDAEKKYEESGKYFGLLLEASKHTIHLENPENAQTFFEYGYYLLETGNDSAIIYLNKAFKIFDQNQGYHDRDIAVSLISIGDYYASKGDDNTALKYFHKSLIAIAPNFKDTSILSFPFPTDLNPDIRVMFSLYKKAGGLTNCYNINHNLKYLVAAANTYQLNFDLIDQLRTNLLEENSQFVLQNIVYDIYTKAIDNYLLINELTGEDKWLEKAFEASEKGKSMILLHELHDVNARRIGMLPEELANFDNDLKRNINLYKNNIWEEENQKNPNENKIAYLRANLLTLEERHDSLKNQLRIIYPDYYKFKYNYSVVSVEKLQRSLARDEVVVEYSLAANNLYIFLVNKYDLIVKSVPIDSSLVKGIFVLRNNLDFDHVSEYDFKDFLEYQFTAYSLYSNLIKPIEQYIENKKLIIIPDEELNYLSFEALINKVTPLNDINFRDLPYLIKICPVSYASSATILAMVNKSRPPAFKNGVLALAPSTEVFTKNMLKDYKALVEKLKNDFDLPGATYEAESILKVMKGEKLIGEQATESAFKKRASLFDILHFATHTNICDENPLSSELSFYPYGDTGEDGKLHTYEIYSLPLKGQLAVLSACSTGNGKLSKGEGVISMARAFTYAGIPSIVMTLWNVEDISSGNIIPSFYYMLENGVDKDEALRQTKLNYLISTKAEIETHPAFWSGFVLYGNTKGFKQTNEDAIINLLVLTGVLIILFSFVLNKKFRNFKKNVNGAAKDLSSEFQSKDGI